MQLVIRCTHAMHTGRVYLPIPALRTGYVLSLIPVRGIICQYTTQIRQHRVITIHSTFIRRKLLATIFDHQLFTCTKHELIMQVIDTMLPITQYMLFQR